MGGTRQLNINLMDRLSSYDGYDFTSSPFFHKTHPGYELRHLFNFNEILSCLVNVPLNIAVILTFCRVAGLDRLPSRLFVSMAASQLLASAQIILHMLTVNSEFFGTSALSCRIFCLFLTQRGALLANVLTSAVVERLLAHCTPNFYSRAGHIFGPALICAPWVFFVYALIFSNIRYYESDFGYNCNSHFNLRPTNMEFTQILIGANSLFQLVFWALLVTVFLSRTVNSGDPIENNRAKFERRTTFLIIMVVLSQYIVGLPVVRALMFADFSRPVQTDEMVHGAMQITLYAGACLFLVLFTRKEFRRQLRYAFSSRELISRQKKTNMLVPKNTGKPKPTTDEPDNKSLFEEGTASERSKLGSFEASGETDFHSSNYGSTVPTMTSRDQDYEMPDFLSEPAT